MNRATANPATKSPAGATTNGSQDSALAQVDNTISQSFLQKVERQFRAELGSELQWTALERTLCQHIFLRTDQALAAAEAKRKSQYNAVPYTWDNVNLAKFAIDAVPRVILRLDALMKNHISPVAYLNSRTKKYEIDLMIGYEGKIHVARNFSLDPILDIRYGLVHETDQFDYSDGDRESGGIAWVQHKRTNPFNPGPVIGGFGYISYLDPRLNRVVIVEFREFEKARKASKGKEFWGGEFDVWEGPSDNRRKTGTEYDERFEKEMQYKTVAHRVSAKVQLDSAKVNRSLAAIESARDEILLVEVTEDAAEHANQQPLELPAMTQIAMPAAVQEPEVVTPPAPVTADGRIQVTFEDEE